MSARGKWFITPHAVDRYRSRCRGGIPYLQALGELIRYSETATFSRWVEGEEGKTAVYVSPRPERWRFRVSTVLTEKRRLPQLLTVLGRGEPDGGGAC